MKRTGQPVLFDAKVCKKSCQWQVFCIICEFYCRYKAEIMKLSFAGKFHILDLTKEI